MRARQKVQVWALVITTVVSAAMLIPGGLGIGGWSPAANADYGYDEVTVSSESATYTFAYEPGSNPLAKRVVCRASCDGGATWHLAPISSVISRPARISAAAMGRNAYVAWEDTAGKIFSTYYAASMDSGKSWSRPVELGGANPTIAVSASSFSIATSTMDGTLRLASGAHGAAPSVSDLPIQVRSKEATVGFDADGSQFIVLYGGLKGGLNKGIYYTVQQNGAWQEPALIAATTGGINSIRVDTKMTAKWDFLNEKETGSMQTALPAWGAAPNPVTVVSSAPVKPAASQNGLAPSRLPPKKWTFVCYLDGDNSLASFATTDINEMELTGSTADLNIIALYDLTGSADSVCYYVTYDTNTAAIASTVIPLSSINSTWGSEVNMGNPQTAIDLMMYVYANYPAAHYAWDFWDHGGSWNWMQCEDAVSVDELTALDTRTIYEALKAKTGNRTLWDVVCFDECILADTEVVYDAKQYCNYTVFSEDSIAGDGYDYTAVLNHLKTNPNMGGEEFGAWVCHEYYVDYVVPAALSTLAEMNNTAFDYDLAPALNSWGQKMRHKANTYDTQISNAANTAMDWQGITYQPDLRHFAQLISSSITSAMDPEINSTTWKVINLTAANAAGDMYGNGTWVSNRPILIHDYNTNANGLTIYGNQAFDTTYNTLKIAYEWNWGKLVENVWGATSVDVVNEEPTCLITAPAEGSYVTLGSSCAISGTASDAADGGTVQRVQVKIDREEWKNATGTTSWTYTWSTVGWAPGAHRITARSWDGTDYSEFWVSRNVTEIVDPTLPDLTIFPAQVTFSNPTPSEGNLVTINATVRNVGTFNPAVGVEVGFYVGNPDSGGSLIGAFVPSTPSTIGSNNSSAWASVVWDTSGWAGNRDIYVVADPGYTVNELTDGNNTVIKPITVSGYGVDLSCAANTSTVQAGGSHTYAIEVKNSGTITDSINLTIDNPTTWGANFNNNPPSGKSATLPAERPVSGYHTYPEIQAELDAIEAAHPAIAKKYVIGTSWEGRNLSVMKISDNVAVNESEPGAFIMGNHHAREWMTVEVPLYYLNYLVNNYGTDDQVTWLVDNREIYILPSVNPDGLNYSQFSDSLWRKNRRNNGDGTFGVDLNRNYNGSQNGDPNGAFGGVGSSGVTSDDTYHGPSAFSEPETRAIRDFVLNRTNIALSISYHSYAEEIYWPWGYSTSVQTPDDAAQHSVASDFAAINGYTAVQSAVPYATTGDTDDWCYGYFRYMTNRSYFPFTIELDSAFQPPVSQIPTTCALNLGVNLEAAQRAGDLFKTAPAISHAPLPNTLNTINPYIVNASLAAKYGLGGAPTLYWRAAGGSYAPVAMTPYGSPGNYTGQIPAQPDGTWVNYYITGSSVNGTSSTSPAYAPNARHSFFVGADIVTYTVGNLTAGATRIVNLTVTAPFSALPNEEARISVVGTSQGNAAKSDAQGTVTTVAPAIILVNDGNAAIAEYQKALADNGYKYDNGTPTSDLSRYKIAIWATDGSAPIDSAEKTALKNFMSAGGSVYINGEDIGYSISANDDTSIGLGASPNNFYGLYLHSNYLADSSGGTLVNGITGDPITDGMANYDISGSFPEAISARDSNTSSIFLYNDATTRAGAVKANTSAYKLVYIGFEYFEGTTDAQANKDLLMYRIIEWLNPDKAPTVSVTSPNAPNTVGSGVVTIQWSATDDNPLPANPIDIYYSANGGGTWNTVATGVANTGTYAWNVGAIADGVNYLVRARARDSLGQTGQDESDNPFSIDNVANDRWHMQVQSAVAGFKDLDMKPVELADNSVFSNISAPGDYMIGSQRYISGAMPADRNVAGNWRFSVWGRVTSGSADGRLFAKVYSYNGATTLLFQTALDDESVGSFTAYHNFDWTYTAPSGTVHAGERVVVEIWLNATAGSGSSAVPNYATSDMLVSGTLGGTYLQTQGQDNAYENLTEVSGLAWSQITNQSFDNGGAMPAGWTITNTSGWAWRMTNDNARYGAICGAPATDYAACCDSDLAGIGVTVDSWIKSPVFSCSGYANVSLTFAQYYNWYSEVSPEGIEVYVSNTGAVGPTSTVVYSSRGADIPLENRTVDISSVAANQGSVQIGWRYRASYDYYWLIDDVVVNGGRNTSYLEHRWPVTVPAGKSPYTFRVDAYRTNSTDWENYTFAYSTDNATFTDMVTIAATSDTNIYLNYTLPTTLNGTVYVRVKDTDRTAGRTVLDTLRVDHMYIESVEGAPQMIMAYDFGTHQSFIEPALGSGTAAYFRIPVVLGWNLVSTPLIPSNTSLPAALTDSNGDTLWDRVQAYSPFTPGNLWKQYYGGWASALNDLTGLDHTCGAWVYVTAVGDGYLNVSGTAPTNASIALATGWNLIGYPARNDTTYTVGQLMSATGATTVEGFNASTTYRTSPLGASTVMKRGQAYWVYVPSATTWWVDW
ncbi:MAG: choice-of-anchor J domain-containing protein [Euryarchaeota archaeon]|nr:choice-of-anchor J domain-containing protein [Euryarchaeota archaeon]